MHPLKHGLRWQPMILMLWELWFWLVPYEDQERLGMYSYFFLNKEGENKIFGLYTQSKLDFFFPRKIVIMTSDHLSEPMKRQLSNVFDEVWYTTQYVIQAFCY